jgi:hypothetical protein
MISSPPASVHSGRMPLNESREPTLHLAALLLVIGAAVAGMLGCALGAMHWGLLGLGIGLLGSWSLFLAGLVGLYRRERRLEATVVAVAAESAAVAGHYRQYF